MLQAIRRKLVRCIFSFLQSNLFDLLFAGLASSAQDLPPLGKHVQVHLREQRNVQQHDEPQEVEIGEGEVGRIGHLDAPLFGFAHVALGPEEAQQLTRHSDRIESDEGRVPEEDDEVWNSIDQVESVVAVPDDFRNGPCEQGKWQSRGGLTGWSGHYDATHDHNSREHLEGRDDRIAWNDPRQSVYYLHTHG